MTLPPESTPSFPQRLTQPDPRRALVLAALGAVLGLVLAGLGLFTARGTRTSAVPPEDMAVVNGVPILRVDFNDQLRLLHDASPSQASMAQKKEVLDQMIAEELAVQRGVELNMPADDVDTRAALVGAVRGSLATETLAAVPSEAELQSWFDAHREHYAEQGRMQLAAWRAPSQALAVQAVAALRQGQPMADVVARYRLVATGRVDDGEEFYFAAALHLGARLFAVARGLHDGAVSDPVATPQGPAVLVMKHNRAPVPETFAQARDRVQVDYVRARLGRLEADNARFLRSRADVLLSPELR